MDRSPSDVKIPDGTQMAAMLSFRKMKKALQFGWLWIAVGLQAHGSTNDLPNGLYAEVTTPRGVVIGELFYKKAPLTVANYVGLAEGTLGPEPRHPFFDGLTFHRIVPGFVAQGGDPTATGDGGPGYSFPDELVPGLRHDSIGVMQMANDGPDTNGSQWCFMLGEAPRLNYLHSVFGHVVQGKDVLPQIQVGDTMKVRILRIGSEARSFRADVATFQKLAAKIRPYRGPKEPGPTAFFDDPDKLLPLDPPRARNFNFKLANFQRFTGRRIVARVYGKAPTEAEPDNLGKFTKELARHLGVGRSGAMALYLADRSEWRMWIGDEWVALFESKAARPGGGVDQPSLHEAKQMFFAEARHRASALAEASQTPLTASQKLKLEVDAVLDGLIDRFEPRK